MKGFRQSSGGFADLQNPVLGWLAANIIPVGLAGVLVFFIFPKLQAKLEFLQNKKSPPDCIGKGFFEVPSGLLLSSPNYIKFCFFLSPGWQRDKRNIQRTIKKDSVRLIQTDTPTDTQHLSYPPGFIRQLIRLRQKQTPHRFRFCKGFGFSGEVPSRFLLIVFDLLPFYLFLLPTWELHNLQGFIHAYSEIISETPTDNLPDNFKNCCRPPPSLSSPQTHYGSQRIFFE